MDWVEDVDGSKWVNVLENDAGFVIFTGCLYARRATRVILLMFSRVLVLHRPAAAVRDIRYDRDWLAKLLPVLPVLFAGKTPVIIHHDVAVVTSDAYDS